MKISKNSEGIGWQKNKDDINTDGGDVDLSSYATKEDIPTKTSQLDNDSNFISSIPSEYITETELNAKGYLTEHQSLDNYALKSEIPSVPTKISQLQNDSNFISSIPEEYVTEQELNSKGLATETFVTNKIEEAQLGGGEIDLSGYATKEELNTKVDKVNGKGLSTEDYTTTEKNKLANLSTVATSGNYNDLTNKPSIPTKTSQLINDSGYLTEIPSEYVTETELNAKGYLTEHQDISGKANTSDLSTVATSGNYNDLTNKPTIPSKTSQLTNDSGYLTNIPSEYVTESELTEYVNSLRSTIDALSVELAKAKADIEELKKAQQ